MKIGRIAHAGISLETGTTRCLIDPLLTTNLESFAFEPAMDLNREKLRSVRWDAIIVSHDHTDHFSLESLALLDPKTPVYLPAGDRVMHHYLMKLGFNSIHEVAPLQEFAVGDIQFVATPSLVEFPEMGLLISSGGVTCWNMVDSIVDPSVIRVVRRIAKKIDVLLCPYQPLTEREFNNGTFAGEFPGQRYNRLLENAASAGAELVVPTACGIKMKSSWVNERLFPITEDQFIVDLRKHAPRVRMEKLVPGDVLHCSNRKFYVKRQALSFIRAKRRKNSAGYDWNPNRGVPELRDLNPSHYKLPELKKRVRNYLNGEFLAQLERGQFLAWKKDLCERQLLWELELVFPDGGSEKRMLEFDRESMRWRSPRLTDFPHIRTLAAASVIPDVLDGRIPHIMPFHLGLVRNVSRICSLAGQGKSLPQEALDPLSHVICYRATERNFSNRVKFLKRERGALTPTVWQDG